MRRLVAGDVFRTGPSGRILIALAELPSHHYPIGTLLVLHTNGSIERGGPARLGFHESLVSLNETVRSDFGPAEEA